MKKILALLVLLIFGLGQLQVLAAEKGNMGLEVRGGIAKRQFRPQFDPMIGVNVTFPLLKYMEYDVAFLTGLDAIYSVSQTINPGKALNMYYVPLSLRATNPMISGLTVHYDVGLLLNYMAAPGVSNYHLGYHAGASAIFNLSKSLALRGGISTYSTGGSVTTISGSTANVSDAPLLLTLGLVIQ